MEMKYVRYKVLDFMLWPKNDLLMYNEELLEFPMGAVVTTRYTPNHEGTIIQHEFSKSILFGPRVKILWHKTEFAASPYESDWINARDLKLVKNKE